MRNERQHRTVFRLGLLSASIAALCLILLVGDYLLAVSRAPADKSRVEALVQQVKTDDAIAPQLEEERERQTEGSLARKTRARILAWVLLVCTAGFVAAGKRYTSLRPRPWPDLDDLVTDRFASLPPAAENGSKPAATGPTNGQGIDLAFVDDLVARVGSGREAAIPILQAIQSHFRYLPDEALRRVCELTEITASQVAGTSSFYAQFRRSPVGRHVVRVCHGTACHVAGAEQITNELRRHLEIPDDEDTDPRRLFTLDNVACVGCCSLAPVIMIEEETAGRLTPASARQTLDRLASST